MGPYVEVCARPARHSRPRSTRTPTHARRLRRPNRPRVLYTPATRLSFSTVNSDNSQHTAHGQTTCARKGGKARARVPSALFPLVRLQNVTRTKCSASTSQRHLRWHRPKRHLFALSACCAPQPLPPLPQPTSAQTVHPAGTPPPRSRAAAGHDSARAHCRRRPPSGERARPLTCDSRTPDGMRPFPAR